MAVDWNLYGKLLGNGSQETSRDVSIQQAADVFTNGVVDDPAYQEDAIVNGELTPIVASQTSSIECAFKGVPGTKVRIGDIVECMGEHWIVVELYIDKVGIVNGKLWLCNDTIKFQNRSPVVHARYCVVDDGTYGKRTTDSEIYEMENTYKVYLSLDSATRYLFVDKRLALGEIFSSSGEPILEVYKIVGIDVKSKNFGKGSHLMVLTVQRDIYDPEEDSLADNLCDVYNGSGSISTKSPTGTVSIEGRDVIRIGTSRKYTAVYTDSAGDRIADVETNWEVTEPDGVVHMLSEGVCTVTVPLIGDLVGSEIILRATSPHGNYGSYEKKVQVVTVG